MSESKRITVEEVRAAYEKTGLKPMQHEYIRGDCACPLTALLKASDKAAQYGHPLPWCDHEYGASYGIGFVRGFDGRPIDDGSNASLSRDRLREGYADGQACAAALLTK